MDERCETDKIDEIMLPGFRFHPTDEELVGFYLKRKVQQRPLSIELIKQLDIYKYDPWDLPKLATTGEKEWYFYCPRDRKYRNSARPNRVTGAGFWKATGTDRPIYSSEGKCIGLKKSLVFYKGRAAKGIKTDWMMHEFRLPSLTDSAAPHKRFIDKNIPPIDSWAICRIFKKTNSSAQRAISHSWVSPLSEPPPTSETVLTQNTHQLINSDNFLSCNNSFNQQSSSSTTIFSPSFDIPYKPYNHFSTKPPPNPVVSVSNIDLPLSYALSSLDSSSKSSIVDASSILLNMSSSMFGNSESMDFSGLQDQCNGFSIGLLPQQVQAHPGHGEEAVLVKDINTPLFTSPETWRSNLIWDSSPCPSEMSTSYSTNKCYI
ncbi:hypothetical protein NMG60_11036275 [Bertholletia excelsa]